MSERDAGCSRSDADAVAIGRYIAAYTLRALELLPDARVEFRRMGGAGTFAVSITLGYVVRRAQLARDVAEFADGPEALALMHCGIDVARMTRADPSCPDRPCLLPANRHVDRHGNISAVACSLTRGHSGPCVPLSLRCEF